MPRRQPSALLPRMARGLALGHRGLQTSAAWPRTHARTTARRNPVRPRLRASVRRFRLSGHAAGSLCAVRGAVHAGVRAVFLMERLCALARSPPTPCPPVPPTWVVPASGRQYREVVRACGRAGAGGPRSSAGSSPELRSGALWPTGVEKLPQPHRLHREALAIEVGYQRDLGVADA